MQNLFTTDGVGSRTRFQQWRDICEDRIVPMDQSYLDEDLFDATIDGVSVGDLDFTKFSLRNLQAATTPRTIRHENHRTDLLFVSMVLRGTVKAIQHDRSSTDGAGEFAIRDTNTPWTIQHTGYSEVLAVAIPRERLENTIGSARNYTALTVGADLPSTSLTLTFFKELVRVGAQLTPDAASRMSAVGVDLIVASIAERMAKEIPRPLHGVVMIQRAKAYVEAHFRDPTLDPPQLAAAVGLSLRRLQELFHERGQHISDWIWQRRLAAAASRLADPGHLHMSLGALAYGCGFASQSHFSRRFKNCYGLSPGEYRHSEFMKNNPL